MLLNTKRLTHISTSQVYNATTSTWVSTPANLLESYDVVVRMPWTEIDEILEKLGWQDVEKFINEIIKDRYDGFIHQSIRKWEGE